FRQLELYDFFGWQPPQFAHVPLVVGPDGRRLAKRHGDTRLSTLRDACLRPERLVGLLAHSAGLIEHPQPVTTADLVAHFDIRKISPEKFVFTEEHLAWLLSSATSAPRN